MKTLTLVLTIILLCAPLIHAKEAIRSRAIDMNIPLEGVSLLVLNLPRTHLLFTSENREAFALSGVVTTEVERVDLDRCVLTTEQKGEVLTVRASYPRGEEGRLFKRNCWFDVGVALPRDIDIRFQLGMGSATLAGPFEKKFVLKLGNGQIQYHRGSPPPHDLEAKAVVGKIRSEIEDVLPRPFFPLGKRILILDPEGRGDVFLKVNYGTITVSP